MIFFVASKYWILKCCCVPLNQFAETVQHYRNEKSQLNSHQGTVNTWLSIKVMAHSETNQVGASACQIIMMRADRADRADGSPRPAETIWYWSLLVYLWQQGCFLSAQVFVWPCQQSQLEWI